MLSAPAQRGSAALAIGLCFLIALLEGVDLQSVGGSAPGIGVNFGLTVSQMGAVFSAAGGVSGRLVG